MIYFKGHETDKGTIIAMCDEELLGRVLKEGKRELDLEKYSGFYNEELITEQEAKSRIKDDLYTANVVGKRSVQIFIEKGLAQKSDVMTIQKVPFIQIFKMV
jgi:hypothetical protein